MIVKRMPVYASFQETLADGRRLYVAKRKAYIVRQTPDGEIIDALNIIK